MRAHGGYIDYVQGYEGFDELRGQEGIDDITAGQGDDTAYGGTGNDVLRGSQGGDFIYGGDGNDVILGGDAPTDRMTGEGQKDDIIDDCCPALNEKDYACGGAGVDTVTVEDGDEEDIICDYYDNDIWHKDGPRGIGDIILEGMSWPCPF